LAICTAIGTGAFALGNSLGFFLPTLIVKGPVISYGTQKYPIDWANPQYPQSQDAITEVGKQLFWLFLGQAAWAAIFFILGNRLPNTDKCLIDIFQPCSIFLAL
jgi:hypothetical protein